VIPAASATCARLRIALRGAVQGVGFRPFLHRLAGELGLAGFVRNGPAGVLGEFEGPPAALAALLERIPREKPPRAAIHGTEHAFLDPVGHRGFEILESATGEAATAVVLPDIATCADCLREMSDPADRRHRYPFINCTHCGPRYTIVESLPYDRPRTTMKAFPMCGGCRAEYEDPGDRRFHAQPVACPECGPRLELRTPDGVPQAGRDEALRAAAKALREGSIVAVKGVGGFHLMADARNDPTVKKLRERKGRDEKPFAVLYPSLDLVRKGTRVSSLEESLLASPEGPIVLIRRQNDGLAPSVAPGNPYLGILLPSNPLHHLLAGNLGFPVVATSGNLSEEPICTDNAEALERLGGIADLFLVHDRASARPVDDSIVRVVLGRPLLLRRARGHAPLPVGMRGPSALPALALGAQLKNTLAISIGEDAVISQHLGDLGSGPAFENFRNAIRDMEALYAHRPRIVACDLHPDYRSTRHAASLGLPVVGVQHHHAHVLACMTENEIEPPALGVAWDGTGWGPDGTVWGGEFLRIAAGGFDRAAHLRTFGLPGGEKAVVEPRRAALGVLFEIFGSALPGDLAPIRAFERGELAILLTMLENGLRTPRTSSAGRLFDAVAALLGLRQRCTFEGQAAMDLEFSLEGWETDEHYDGAGEDWEPVMRGILDDLRHGVPAGRIAARFHNSLAEAIVSVARRLGEEKVVLSGGCFQNRILTERTVQRLGEEGFRPYWHQRIPPNDGGIALGQLAALRPPAAAGRLDTLGRR
jgi:hydrogenase maturation protein HypF